MHYAGNDWANAQIAGLKDQFGKLGIEVVAITDANFKPDKQVSDLETVMSQEARHHRVHPDRPGRHRRGVQGGRGGRREARLHGQRARRASTPARTTSRRSPPTTSATVWSRRT